MSGIVCRVPPRRAAPFLIRTRNGGKKPQGAWAACPGCARSALRATAARGRSAPRPRLESASQTRPCGPDSLQGWPAAKSLRPQRRLRLACGQSRRRPVTDQRTGVQHPASRRAAGAMPLPVSLRNRIGRAPGEARPLLRGAQRLWGGGKRRGFAAHARRACERPERALFSAAGFGEPSGFNCWERPQPELSLQLVYLLGAAVTCGYWQGTPGDTAWSSGPQGRVRVADSSRGRGAERPQLRSADRVSEANRRRRLLGRRSAVARSALRASAEGVLSGFRPFGPGRMATPYGESKGVAKRQPEWEHHLSRRDKWRLWPSLNARRRRRGAHLCPGRPPKAEGP